MILIDYSACTFPFRRLLRPGECKRSGKKRKGGNTIRMLSEKTVVNVHYRGQLFRRTFRGDGHYQRARRHYSHLSFLKLRELRFWDTMPHVVEAYKAFTVIGFRTPNRKGRRQRWRFPFSENDPESYLRAFEEAKLKYFDISEPKRLRDGFAVNPYREFDSWIPDPPVIPGQSTKAFTAIDPVEELRRAIEYAP